MPDTATQKLINATCIIYNGVDVMEENYDTARLTFCRSMKTFSNTEEAQTWLDGTERGRILKALGYEVHVLGEMVRGSQKSLQDPREQRAIRYFEKPLGLIVGYEISPVYDNNAGDAAQAMATSHEVMDLIRHADPDLEPVGNWATYMRLGIPNSDGLPEPRGRDEARFLRDFPLTREGRVAAEEYLREFFGYAFDNVFNERPR